MVLDALLDERNVTRAAEAVGVTQSATSHSLTRLRALMGDALLVRAHDGMTPTTRAEALAAPVRRALDEVRGRFASPRTFDPSTAREDGDRVDRLRELLLFPRLVARLAREAPGIDLRVVPFGVEALDPLSSGARRFGPAPVMPTTRAGHVRRKLFDERFVCVVRRGTPSRRRS